MSRPIITDHKLTAADCKALREADTVSFSYAPNVQTDKPASFIHASSHKIIGAHGESKWSHYIPAGYHATIYDRDTSTYGRELESAFEMIGSAHYDPVWKTLASLLRPGDVLTLHWVAGGKTNDYMANATLYGDELQLIVQRGKRRMTFIVDTSTNPGNSARMCRVATRREEAA